MNIPTPSLSYLHLMKQMPMITYTLNRRYEGGRKPPKNSQTSIHTDPKLGMDDPTPTLISSTSLAKVLVTTFTQKNVKFFALKTLICLRMGCF